MIFCNGGQHAIWISLAVLNKEKITIVTDEIPFAGLLWIAKDLNIGVVGVSSDREGMCPDELDRVSKEVKRTGRQPVLYISPTAQNPTGISLSNSRMVELLKICQSENMLIIEDDVYTAFSSRNHSTFADMAPDITFYINSLAKILSPWFRLGVLVCPPRFHKTIMSYVSTNGAKISPIIAEVMQQWVTSGLASEVAMMTHQEGVRRNELAKQAFAGIQNALIGNGFHMFLPMSQDDSKSLWTMARRQGIRLSKPAISLNQDPNRSGIRICLGVPTIFDLKFALAKVAEAHLKVTAARNHPVSSGNRPHGAQVET
ncbi:hypothetical protein MESS2_p110014 [Mesorhizobium metallidurans STM 2683]|uniref:Aminotransferase class I/classII large domain-containing protein n=2 Tax=Mesorhizobium metallidurans TaxID=489722 RepID=M5EZS7_9HYPH|nr:hypothetical protein MESS2_p110014 [Mesorhizobium metallidurans STM 2683]